RRTRVWARRMAASMGSRITAPFSTRATSRPPFCSPSSARMLAGPAGTLLSGISTLQHLADQRHRDLALFGQGSAVHRGNHGTGGGKAAFHARQEVRHHLLTDTQLAVGKQLDQQ